MPTSSPMLFVRFRKRVRIKPGNDICLGAVAQIITESDMEHSIKKLVLRKPSAIDGNMVLIDMMQVVRRVKESVPEMQIECYGEPHCLVEISEQERKPNWIGAALVWFILFVGSGLAIMNFHADVSMVAVHQRIYELMTGNYVERPYLLQIPYSLGIGAGMIIFFNHLLRKKFNEEPSPLEVEMFLYQESMNHYVITEEYIKLHGSKDAKAHDGGVS